MDEIKTIDVSKLPVIDNPSFRTEQPGSLGCKIDTHAVIKLPVKVVRYLGKKKIAPLAKKILFKLHGPLSYWIAFKKFMSDQDPDQFFTNHVIVLKTELRPIIKDRGNIIVTELNKLYSNIIQYSNRLVRLYGSVLEQVYQSEDWFDELEPIDTQLATLQFMYDKIVEYYLNMLSGKEGSIRSDILGCTIDFSGRAVIVADPSLETVYQVKLPKDAERLWMPEYLRYKAGMGEHVADVIERIREGEQEVEWEVIPQERRRVLIGRQPTLWRFGCVGVDVVGYEDKVIKIHPMSVEPFNADFDGDSFIGEVEIYTEDGKFVTHVENLVPKEE